MTSSFLLNKLSRKNEVRKVKIMQSYQNLLKKIGCPVCYKDSVLLLWSADSKEAAKNFVLQEQHPERFFKLVSHIETLWGQNTCEVVKCCNCDFCFSYPYIAGDAQFYSLAYVRSGYPKWKWEFQLTFDVVSNISDRNLKLLEIGAGNGAFIRRIVGKYLPKENITCIEFSDYGRQTIENLGVKCLPEDVRNLSNPALEKNFDVICMFQVLEHMDKLDVLFQKLNWLLKNGGSVFISVPNPSRIEFNELNSALLDMPPNHIGRWNKKCYEEIGKRYGFHVNDFRVEGLEFFSMVKQFVIYRFLKSSQRTGSFENKVLTIKNRYLLRIMQILAVGVNFIAAVPALIKMNSGHGNSLWIHLKKTKD